MDNLVTDNELFIELTSSNNVMWAIKAVAGIDGAKTIELTSNKECAECGSLMTKGNKAVTCTEYISNITGLNLKEKYDRIDLMKVYRADIPENEIDRETKRIIKEIIKENGLDKCKRSICPDCAVKLINWAVKEENKLYGDK